MNGEVNGTMDKPMETSVPKSPDNLQNQKDVVSEGCDNATNVCENSSQVEDSHHLDSESRNESVNENNPEYMEDENSTASEDQESLSQNTEASIKVPENETSNTSFAENSNGSFTGSMTSSQAKSESTDHPNNVENDLDEKSKDGQPENQFAKNLTTNENTENEMDSEEDSSVEEEEGFEGQPRPDDTVSINSESGPEEDGVGEGEDESSHDSDLKNKSNDIIILENETSHNQNGTNHNSPSPEVHEIVSDNEEGVAVQDKTKPKDNIVQLRRSSRAIKRKRYTDEMENGGRDYDVQEVPMGTPFKRKSKPIIINDTKALVEMAAKQMKANQNNNQKKEPTVVIIDTHSLMSEKSLGPHKITGMPSNASLNAQNLYKSIAARGTTVTAVKTSSTQVSESKQNASQSQAIILPSLTDDMFVVEAPSFIVPYVYEKPSIKPFREFVDILGKELDEQKAKEEKELEEKLKKEKEEKDKEKQEKKERGEEVDESEEETASSPTPSAGADATSCSVDTAPTSVETAPEGEEKKKKKKGQKRNPNDDDDASWHGDTSSDSDDEILSDEDKTIIIKEKVDDVIAGIKDVTHLTVDKVCSTKSDNYFDCSLGKFFINIGLSLVQEYVQSDLLKQQNRKLYREKKTGQDTKSTETSISSLMKNIEFSKENNAPYSFPQQKCEFCSFKSESKLVMSHHLETPHMKNNVYKCNFCSFEIRSPHDILYHMEAEHNIRGKLERAPAYHQCANCPFEDNGKGKLARHLIPCAKKFKPDLNLTPPLEWEPPAKIPKIARARNNMMSGYQSAFKNQLGTNLVRPLNVAPMMPGVSAYRPRGRSATGVQPRAPAVHGTPILRGGVMVRHNSPVQMSNYPVANNGNKKQGHQPSISITPLPRQPQPQAQQPQPAHNTKSAFVICEICDGYIKDLEQLRNHMQWIHKVKIHPKMIYNRPPLNCQKCQFRFFTDQGLERHLLGSHGLVTSSMQEAANKGKDAGRCPVCGRVYQWKLLNHVARDHNLTLKPAHLSYKCTVCTATFGMYKQFENHVYSAHSVVAKRVMDKSKTAPKPNNDSLLKPLKINDEITIIPQPVKAAAGSKDE